MFFTQALNGLIHPTPMLVNYLVEIHTIHNVEIRKNQVFITKASENQQDDF